MSDSSKLSSSSTLTMERTQSKRGFGFARKKRVLVGGVGLLVAVLLAVGWYFADQYWPYRYRNVKPLLESVFASKLTIEHYHRTYFPHPGFVATGMTLRRNNAPDLPPVGSTQKLIVQGNWMDLLMLRNRVRLVDVVGLHVVIPPVGSAANHEEFPPGSSTDFAGPTTMVETFAIHHARLDIMRTNGSRYSFPIEEVRIGNLQAGHAISYTVDMVNARPTGRIQSSGSFGPLLPKNLGGTRLSGRFTFSKMVMKDIGGVSGMMDVQGKFSGTLAAIEAEATSKIPDFAVGDGRPTGVEVSAQGTVNGLDRNMTLRHLEVTTGKTAVEVQGKIVGAPKVTDLDLVVTRGRVEDLLGPFVKDQPPITGMVWVKAHVHLDAAEHGATFLQRLKMDGTFDVPAERVTDRATETSLSQFSDRAQKDPSKKDEAPGGATDVVSSLQGAAVIRDGVASTSRLTFVVPGAKATLKGRYNLSTGAVNLTGNLKMQNDISHVTTGFKSALLKPFAPFFKKKKAGAVVPIAITGMPGKYRVGEDLLHDK